MQVLNQTGSLSESDWKLIQEHPATGYEILKTIEYPWPLAEMVYQHHERIDGSGYPRGKTGGELLLESQILGVSDVMEAIMLARPYREALGKDSALKELENQKGKAFEAKIVDACAEVFAEGFNFEDIK